MNRRAGLHSFSGAPCVEGASAFGGWVAERGCKGAPCRACKGLRRNRPGMSCRAASPGPQCKPSRPPPPRTPTHAGRSWSPSRTTVRVPLAGRAFLGYSPPTNYGDGLVKGSRKSGTGPEIRPAYTTRWGRAYHADALELLPRLPAESVALVITSPPFALRRQKAYGNVSAAEYLDWFWPFAEQI